MALKILIFLSGGFLFLLVNFVFSEKKETEKMSDLQIVFESAWQGGFREAENFYLGVIEEKSSEKYIEYQCFLEDFNFKKSVNEGK